MTGNISIGGNVLGSLLPAANVTYDLGSPTQQWRTLYVSSNTVNIGGTALSTSEGNLTVGNSTVGGLNVVKGVISNNLHVGLPNGSVDGIIRVYNATSSQDAITLYTDGTARTGFINATGNITGGNLIGTGIVGTLATASQTNITSVGTLGSLSITGNVNSGNLRTAGLISATGTITSSTSVIGSTLSATGNIYGGNLSGTYIVGTLTTASQTNITGVGTITTGVWNGTAIGASYVGTLNQNTTGYAATVSGAAQGNITSVGTLTALAVTGNISAGNVSATGIAGTLSTAAQTSITSVGTLGSLAVSGNASSATAAVDTNTTQLATTAYVIAQASAATPTTIGTNTIGTSTRYARADHTHTGVGSAVAGTGIGISAATGAVTITNNGVTSLANGGGITASVSTGAVTLGSTATSANTASAIVARDASGNFSAGTITATLTGAATSATTAATVTTAAQGNITSLGILTGLSLPSITHTGTTNVGDIGQSAHVFATVYATTFSGVSTTAKYADLAETYSADTDYLPGTVVSFGGQEEVTLSLVDGDRKIAGVVSTNPAHVMNSVLEANHVVVVALQGRVPTRVNGPVRKGDLMVSAGNGRARAEQDPKIGAVIGKSLEDFDGNIGTIEVVVGRV